MKFSIKKWFTLIEMLIVTVIVSSSLVVIIWVINYWLNYIWAIRQNVVAINLAREGVEWVFNVRDTNWLRWSGRREECWLNEDPLSTDSECLQEPWIWSWSYVLVSWYSADWQYYNYLSWMNDANLDISWWFTDEDWLFALCQDDDRNFWYSCPSESNVTPEWRFYRSIEVKWLYDKTDWDPIECDSWNDYFDGDYCWWSEAKELRFCSIVEYMWRWEWRVELCSSITNFRD